MRWLCPPLPTVGIPNSLRTLSSDSSVPLMSSTWSSGEVAGVDSSCDHPDHPARGASEGPLTPRLILDLWTQAEPRASSETWKRNGRAGVCSTLLLMHLPSPRLLPTYSHPILSPPIPMLSSRCHPDSQWVPDSLPLLPRGDPFSSVSLILQVPLGSTLTFSGCDLSRSFLHHQQLSGCPSHLSSCCLKPSFKICTFTPVLQVKILRIRKEDRDLQGSLGVGV